VWASDKLIPASVVHPFRSNVIDFDSQPRYWAGSAFDYVHYSVPRKGLDDIADDLGYGRVCDYRLAVLEDDLVVAQITKSILSFLGHKDCLSVLALDQFSLILDIAIQSGFNDQPAFKRTFHQFVGVSPGRRRRYYMTNHFRP
jgi:AraC family transcriptional regulator